MYRNQIWTVLGLIKVSRKLRFLLYILYVDFVAAGTAGASVFH